MIAIVVIATARVSSGHDPKAAPEVKPADDAKPAEDKPPVILTKFYDIRSLMTPAPHFTFDDTTHAGGFVVPGQSKPGSGTSR